MFYIVHSIGQMKLNGSSGHDRMIVAFSTTCDHTGGVMVSMLASSAVDHGFEPRTGQTKD